MSNILIIEDDTQSARLMSIMFKRYGQVFVAPDGFQGLKLARTIKPDVVVLDLMLPGIDGFEICNRLRTDPVTAQVPVVIVSAKSQEADRQMAAKVGANAYFSKPYPPADLQETIETLLAKRGQAPAAVMGLGVVFLGARGSEMATMVAVNTALALAVAGERAMLVDLRPYSVEHCMALNLAPHPTPVNLARTALSDALVIHSSGLRLLNNLEGSGEVGQITPSDVIAVLSAVLAGGGYSLIDLPLYPIEALREAATRCALTALVTAFDPPALAAARSTLSVMERVGLGSEHTGLVLIGAGDAHDQPDLGRVVLATLPPSAPSDHPEFQALANRLRGLRRT